MINYCIKKLSLPIPLKILRGAFSLYALKGINSLFPVIIYPLLLRTLGSSHQGSLLYNLSIVTFFQIVIEYSFEVIGTQYVATSKSHISNIHSSIFLFRLVITGIFFSILLLLQNLLPNIVPTTLFCFIPYLLGVSLSPSYVFIGKHKATAYAFICGCCRVVALLLIMTTVSSPTDFYFAVFTISFIPLAISSWGLCYLLLNKSMSFSKPSLLHLQKLLRNGWPLFLGTLSSSVYTIFPIILLGYTSSMSQVALYATIEKIIRSLQNLFGPFAQVLFPWISEVAAKSHEEAFKCLRAIFKWILFFSILQALLFSGGAFWFSPVIIGEKTPHAILLFSILGLIPAITTLGNFFGTQILVALGDIKTTGKILFKVSMISVIPLITFTILFEDIGCAIVVVVIELTLMGCYAQKAIMRYLEKKGSVCASNM